MSRNGMVRLGALADIHFAKDSRGTLQSFFEDVGTRADILALCGDLTHHGLPEEAELLSRELKSTVRVPIVAVLGNHDYEADKQGEMKQVLTEGGIRVLDGDDFEIQGIGFAGTKGFAGGFGKRALEPWGEVTIKRFVRDSVDEALKLESALARLRSSYKVALLHYSPIQETVAGEPPEIYAFLGSSRLEEPINRYAVDVVFHGHAHHGTHEGRTTANIRVLNVSMSLLRRAFPDQPPVHILEIPY